MQGLLYLIVVWSCIEFYFLVLLLWLVSAVFPHASVFLRFFTGLKRTNDWKTPLKRLLWTCGSPVPCSPACRLQLRNIAGKGGGTEGFFPQNLLFVLFFCHNDIWLIASSLLRSSWEVCKILFFVPLLQVQVAGKFNTWPYHSQGDRPMWGELKN